MTDDPRRTSELVELHALCARYMAYTSQFLQDRLELFEQHAPLVIAQPVMLELTTQRAE